jgi:hypothetical protein
VPARGDALVGSLVARYGAVVSSTELPGCVRAVRLVPPVGGPLTLGWSDFPGLRIRVGHWAVSSAPQCGCDACDEDGDSAWAAVLAVVDPFLQGDFVEELTDEYYVQGSSQASSRGLLVAEERARMLLIAPPGRYAWPAWSA